MDVKKAVKTAGTIMGILVKLVEIPGDFCVASVCFHDSKTEVLLYGADMETVAEKTGGLLTESAFDGGYYDIEKRVELGGVTICQLYENGKEDGKTPDVSV